MKKTILVLLVAILLTGCGSAPVETVPTTGRTLPELTVPTEPATAPIELPDPILEQMAEMTVEEKIGQLFIIQPEDIGVTSSPSGMTAALLQEYPVGGFMLAKKNIKDPAQITAFTAAMKAGKVPAFVSVDEEGGKVARFANHGVFDLPKYKSAAAVGASGDPKDALAMGEVIGSYLAEYGVNMDFAPVADVNTNPDNPVIGTRAFSSDPQIATGMAHAMAQGLKTQGVIPVYKHFPGHGDTAQDSHRELAVNDKTVPELETCEWLPYKDLGAEACVMVAHVALPNVTGSMTPASLSGAVVEGILRQKLGFTGVVITDGMQMGAISNHYSSGEAAIKAIEAGCDMILLPQNFKAAYVAVLEAVQDGTLSVERINESVYRILLLKQTYGLW